jgi:hypothetical protein
VFFLFSSSEKKGKKKPPPRHTMRIYFSKAINAGLNSSCLYAAIRA